ncbi:MAG: helix-turn-helix domain-containing protein [Patescibacteria group bacterium]
MENIIIKLGLAPSAAKIYLTMLEHGSLTVSSLSKHSGLFRHQVYKELPSLIDKNLVTKTTLGKRDYYNAESPTILSGLIDELQDELKQALPDYNKLYSTGQHKPIIRYYKGKKGISYVYTDLVNTVKRGDIIYRYESPKDYKKNKKYYPRIYMKKAGQKLHSDIQKFVITNKKTHDQRSKQLERYSKYVPPLYDPFAYDITQLIYGDKVAFIDYQTETASIIESPTFARFQQKIYRLLFQKL